MSAFSGYAAAIECRRVQVERPSSSTSGGHSDGVEGAAADAEAARGVVDVVILSAEEESGEVWFESVFACFARARHEAAEVHVRQLRWVRIED